MIQIRSDQRTLTKSNNKREGKQNNENHLTAENKLNPSISPSIRRKPRYTFSPTQFTKCRKRQ